MKPTDIRTATGNGIARLTLAAPPLNILTRHMMGEMRTSLSVLAADASTRVLVLDADGKHFSAGADVSEHLPPTYERLIPEFLETIDAIVAFPVPVIAAIHGRCLGGGFEIALAADMIIASDDAMVGQPEIALGVTAPASCALLPRKAGWPTAAEITFTGDLLTAADAHRRGIVSEVVPRADLAARVDTMAARIARHSAAALRAAKRTLLDTNADVSAALTRAGDLYLSELMITADAIEGLTAFVEKREPVWTNR